MKRYQLKKGDDTQNSTLIYSPREIFGNVIKSIFINYRHYQDYSCHTDYTHKYNHFTFIDKQSLELYL